MSTEMKKLIIGGTEYEIVDESGRTRISALEQGTVIGGGLSQLEKDYLLELFEKAAYAENDASEAFNALSALWADSTVYRTITWSGTGYTKGNAASRVEDGAAYTSTITANTGFNITAVTVTMGGTEVTGAWSNGTVTIPNVTGDIVITVTTAQITVSSISAVYTQSGTVYDTASLDSLKSDLVITATFTDSSTGVIDAAEYTLSGTLTTGTSTITVSYGGQTATFSVTVTHDDGSLYNWDFTQSLVDSKNSKTATLSGATQDSNGVTFNSDSDFIYLANLSAYNSSQFTVEVDFGTFDAETNSYALALATGTGFSTKCGVFYGTGPKWAIKNSANNNTYSSATDSNYFQNKTLKFVSDISGNGQWLMYADGTLLATATAHTSLNNRYYLGIAGLLANTVVKAVRVYEGVV